MRPIKLKIKNLNSFIEEQTIDFEKLTSRGLFGIFGPTGSGKSTILDGITLALYGNVARKSSNFINTNSDKMSVSFEFEIRSSDTKRYIVEREFRRKTNGSINAGKCKLVDITNIDLPEVLADATKALTKKIEEIIGLNLEDFTRTVVLPQGKFSEFLKLEGKERREMLERLFNLQKYGDDLSAKLFSEIAREKQENCVLLGELKGYEDISLEKLNSKNLELKEIIEKVGEIQKELKEIENSYKESEELWKFQIELSKYRNEEKALEERKEEIKSLENKITLGESALRVLPYVNAFQDTVSKYKNNKEQLNKLKIKMEELDSKKKILEDEWKKVKEEKENNLPSLLIREQKISNCIEEKSKLDIISAKINKLNSEIENLQNNIKVNEDTFSSVQKLFEEKDKEIVLVENQYDELKCDDLLKEKVQNGLIYEKNKENISNNLNKQEQRKALILKEKNEIVETGKQIKCDYEDFGKKINEKEALLNELLKNSPGEQKDLIRLNTLISENEHKFKLFEKYNNEIDESLKESNLYEEKIKNNKVNLTSYENKLIELKKVFDIASKEELAKKLREELKDGEVCPVCGSTHHIKQNIDSNANLNLKEIEEQIDGINSLIKELNNEITRDETKLISIKEMIKNNQKEIEALGEDFKKKTLKDLKLESENLEKAIEEYNKNKEKLEDEVNSLKINEQGKAGELKEFRARYKSCESSLNNIENDIKESREELEATNSKLNELKNETKVDNFKEKNEEIRQKEIKRSELFIKMKDGRAKLKELEQKRETLKKEINTINETLAKDKTEVSGYKKNRDEKISYIIREIGTVDNLNNLLQEVKIIINKINSEYEKCEKEKGVLEEEFLNTRENLISCENTDKELEERYKKEKNSLEEAIRKEKFNTIDEVKANLTSNNVLSSYKLETEQYKINVSKIQGAIDNIISKINGRSITKEEFDSIYEHKNNKNKEMMDTNEQKIRISEEVKNIETKLKEQKDLLSKKEKLDYKLSLLSDLEKLFKGKRFVEFVASHQLKYVSIEASKRLKEITHGTYGLEVDEDGRFIIRDYKNGGAARDASTLSGGETFLASLSLALALSAQIQLKGTAPLEFFFLDEGFGTLDDELLEVVMSSLERIHNDKLKIGIISHVESIKNRVPVKLIVTAAESGKGGSKTKIEIS